MSLKPDGSAWHDIQVSHLSQCSQKLTVLPWVYIELLSGPSNEENAIFDRVIKSMWLIEIWNLASLISYPPAYIAIQKRELKIYWHKLRSTCLCSVSLTHLGVVMWQQTNNDLTCTTVYSESERNMDIKIHFVGIQIKYFCRKFTK